MVKRSLIGVIVLSVLLGLGAWHSEAMMLICGRPPVAASGCSSQTAGYSHVTVDTITGDLYDSRTVGTSFVSSQAGDVYGIKVWIDANNDSVDSDMLARIGTSADVSSAYLGGECSVTVTAASTGEYIILCPSGNRPTVDDSSTYYLAIIYDDDVYGERIRLDRSTTNLNYHYTTAAEWNLTGGEDTNYAFSAEVLICD